MRARAQRALTRVSAEIDFDYSMKLSDFFEKVSAVCQQMGLPWEDAHIRVEVDHGYYDNETITVVICGYRLQTAAEKKAQADQKKDDKLARKARMEASEVADRAAIAEILARHPSWRS